MKNNKVIKGILFVFKTILGILIITIFAIIFLQRISKNSVSFFGYGMYTVVSPLNIIIGGCSGLILIIFGIMLIVKKNKK